MNELLKSGAILMNTYKIKGVIDQGGMGAIYKAESRLLADEEYAVKEMLDNYSSAKEKQEGLDLFKQESDILKQLRHPNLPRVHAFFEENNRYYLVMDYIKGRTLEDIVESTSDYIPESVVLRWTTDLCNILEYLHNQKPPIIFRDLNPRNIMLEEGTGDIKLIDFGIARFFKAGQSSDTLSLGSPGYCPIEQYGRGQTDIRSDVYTLGATLYHLLTKKVPVAAIERIKPTPVALKPPGKINRRISPHVERSIMQAMEINPDSRFQTVNEMRQALFTKGKTRKIQSQKTQKTGAAKTQDTGKKTQQQPPKTAAQQKTGTRTARQTGPARPRSNKSVWFVVLLLASMLGAQWIDGWQDRESGRNADPDGATVLAIPGSARERVSYLAGDRTDWWSFSIAAPGTLTVTVIPQEKTDGLRLNLYDQKGKSILEQGVAREDRLEAVFIAMKPMTVLAQVLAPRIWDGAAYTIHSGFAGPAGRLLASLTDLSSVGLGAEALPSRVIRNYAEPDSAPLLPLNTVINSQLVINEGAGTTWWRAIAPTTGRLTLEIKDANSSRRPEMTLYDADRNPLPVLSKRRGEQAVALLGDTPYFIKIEADRREDMMTYRLTTAFESDPDVRSGDDRAPDGAGALPFQGAIHDTVSYTTGDRTDWWKLTFPETGRITVALQAARSEAVQMRLFEADDVRRSRDEDGPSSEGLAPADDGLNLEAEEGTDYYIAVTADTNSAAIGYALETAFFLDADANSGPDARPDGAKALPVNGSSRGSVDYFRGDRTDWWRVTASSSGLLIITLVAREPAADILMELYDQDGTVLMDKAASSGSGRLELSIDLDGRDTYLIKVFAGSETDASAYQITSWYTVSPDGSSGRDAVPTGAVEMQLGRSAGSSVDYDAGDRTDWWKVEATAPGTMHVELSSEAFLANLDLAVYSESDTKTPMADARSRSGDERISLEIHEPGWYYIKVVAREAGDSSRYTITATFDEQ